MFDKFFKGLGKSLTDSNSETTEKPSSSKPTQSPKQESASGPAKSPEELCGISPDMDPNAVREHLAILYKRHNAAASSLDADLREEAEVMLDAIVELRQKF